MSGLIVVGVDGSSSSIDALKWAAAQARLTGATLEVLTTWEYVVSFGWAPTFPADYNPERDASVVLSEIVERELGSDSDLDVRQTVMEGHPAPKLIEASEKADLLVVGSRGHGAFVGMLLGSVSEHCVANASCPVVVVRSPT